MYFKQRNGWQDDFAKLPRANHERMALNEPPAPDVPIMERILRSVADPPSKFLSSLVLIFTKRIFSFVHFGSRVRFQKLSAGTKLSELCRSRQELDLALMSVDRDIIEQGLIKKRVCRVHFSD